MLKSLKLTPKLIETGKRCQAMPSPTDGEQGFVVRPVLGGERRAHAYDEGWGRDPGQHSGEDKLENDRVAILRRLVLFRRRLCRLDQVTCKTVRCVKFGIIYRSANVKKCALRCSVQITSKRTLV